jgi:hypothetical protein
MIESDNTTLNPWLWSLDGNPNDKPPDNFMKIWISFCNFSPSIIHSNLFRAAIYKEMVTSTAFGNKPMPQSIRSISADCIALRGKSLTYLNSQLRSSGSHAVDDQAIAAVGSFFFNEVRYSVCKLLLMLTTYKWSWSRDGGLDSVTPHIKGLRVMLKMRGGTRALGCAGFISRLLML